MVGTSAEQGERLAVVSGSSSGIGKAVAEKYLACGFAVVGFDVQRAAISHPGYHHLVCDLREELPDEALAKLGDPQVVVCNAGTLEEDSAIEVNLVATMRFAERFEQSPALRSVLFIASASARNGAEFPRYVASKAGVVGYMKNLALKLAPRGVTCNAISPGGVITPANEHILNSPVLYEAVLAETLLGKWAEPEEVADLAYYLTVVNRSITGEDILMDNGEMLKSNFIW